MLIPDFETYIQTVKNIIKEEEGLIRISSYNYYSAEMNKILEQFTWQDMKFMIGMNTHPCSESCSVCSEKILKTKARLAFPHFYYKAKISPKLHMKYFSRGNQAIIGGMNLTNSDYADLSYVVTKKSQIKLLNEHFDQTYSNLEVVQNMSEHRCITWGKYAGYSLTTIRSIDKQYYDWICSTLSSAQIEYYSGH